MPPKIEHGIVVKIMDTPRPAVSQKWPSPETRQKARDLRNCSLSVPLISSLLIHLAVLWVGSILISTRLQRQDLLPVRLIDLPNTQAAPWPTSESPREVKQLPPKAQKPQIERTTTRELTPAIKALTKAAETPPASPAEPEVAASSASSARTEGGGSEAGAGNLPDKGDVAAVSSAGIAGGGGGTAAAGLGHGAGAPGLPAQAAPLRTNREAKPIQSARASYPPMALRAGMEADVILRIHVDPQGNVTRAEISKSGGDGFDEEALKAVKQSRFEPAQKDGQNVPAEFTFVYKFRLQR